MNTSDCQSASNVILSSTYQLESDESIWIKAHFDTDSIIRLHILEGELSIVSHSACESDTIHQFSTNRYTLDVDYFLQGNLQGNEIFYHLKAAADSPAKIEFTLDTAQSGRTIDNPILIDIATTDEITLDEDKQWFTFSAHDDKQVSISAEIDEQGSLVSTLVSENGKQSFQEELYSDDCGNAIFSSSRLSPNLYNIRTVNGATSIIKWTSYTYYSRTSPGELQLEDGMATNQNGVGWFRYSLNKGLKITNHEGPIFKTTSSDTVLLANTGFDIYGSCLPAVYSAKEVTDLLIEVGGTSCDLYCPTFNVGASIPVDSFDIIGSDRDFPLSAEFNVDYEVSPGETSWYQVIIPEGHQLGIKRRLIGNDVRIRGYETNVSLESIFEFTERNFYLYQWPYPPRQLDNDAIFLSSEHSLDTLILSIEVLNPENTRDNFLHSFITRVESRGLYCGDAIEITSGMTTLSQTGEIFFWDHTKKKLDLLITVNKNFEQFILNTWNDFLGSTSDDIYHCYANYPYPSLVRLSDSSSTHTQFVIETSSLSSSASDSGAGLLGFKIDNWEGELKMNVHYINVENEAPYLIDSVLELRENQEQGHLFDLNYAVDPDNESLFYGMRDTISGLSLLGSTNQLVLTDYDLIRSACNASVRIPMYVTDTYDTVNFELSTYYSSESCPNRYPVAKDTVFKVIENPFKNTLIGQFEGSDPDMDPLKYVLLESDIANMMYLDSETGELKVKESEYFNYELDSSLDLRVVASDAFLSDTANVKIIILDSNDKPELIDQQVRLDENIPLNTVVAIFKAADEDGDHLQYGLVSNTSSLPLRIDSQNGEVKVLDSKAFDYEFSNQLSFEIYVTDQVATDTAQLIIDLKDVNEPPQVNDTLFFVNENPNTGDTLGIIYTSDPEGETLTYSIQNQDSAILIDASNEMLTILRPDLFNYEMDSSLHYVIVASDGEFYDSAVIHLQIVDVNEPPYEVILSSNTIAEHTKSREFIGQLIALDEDLDEQFSYELRSEKGSFEISNDSLFSIAPFDYESTTEKELEIVVYDKDSLSFNKNFQIDIIDVILSTTTSTDISIFPNPTNGIIHIIDEGVNSVVLYDTAGRLIHRTSQKFIDLSSYENGIYFLNIYLNNGSMNSKKIILNK
ncbi:MAG: T9SS type A sorting domain-containing protein [Cyclobacteriaceae bacterium]